MYVKRKVQGVIIYVQRKIYNEPKKMGFKYVYLYILSDGFCSALRIFVKLKEFSLAGRLREILQIAKLLVHVCSTQSCSVGADGCGKVELSRIQSN